jgi:hypothetical protein
MVRGDGGQLYTIEGIAAALIMLITAFMVVNATSVYTAGDTHISDMQLEQMGSDALRMMDTKEDSEDLTVSTLQTVLQTGNALDLFRTEFERLILADGTGPDRNIHFNATYTCRIGDQTSPIYISSSEQLSGTEHPVRVTKWVIVEDKVLCGGPLTDRAVLVEVLLWLD